MGRRGVEKARGAGIDDERGDEADPRLGRDELRRVVHSGLRKRTGRGRDVGGDRADQER